MSMPGHIKVLLSDEIRAYDPDGPATRKVGQGEPMSPDWHRQTIRDFMEALIEPEETEVHFSGGATLTCWSVTRSNGAYRVIYIPWTGNFSLAVESKYGPVDIGVHGDAMGCFGSV